MDNQSKFSTAKTIYFKNVPTKWGAQRQRGVWCSVADIWRNPAASPVASRWWGCDPCLSRSPEQRASHACAIALWRPAIEIERYREREREFLIVETERCSAATTNTELTSAHTGNVHLEAAFVCSGKMKCYKWNKILELQALNHYLQYFAIRQHSDLFANTKLNIEHATVSI